jgi:hypothetical protein
MTRGKNLCNQKGCNERTNRRHCNECIKQKYEKQYTLDLIQSNNHPHGGINIYHVKPNTSVSGLRCHYVFHGFYAGYHCYNYTNDCIYSINHWNDVWEKCSGYLNNIKLSQFKGELDRGIMYYCGDSITAVVVAKNRMYLIHGSWS